MPVKIPTWLLILLALVLAGLLARSIYRQGQARAESDRSAVTLASARDSVSTLGDSVRSLGARLAATVARVDTVWRRRAPILAQADTFRRSADSAFALAPVDTGKVCGPIRAAYTLRTSECESNRRALAVDEEALQVARDSLASFRSSAADAGRTIVGLRAQLSEVRKPYLGCHILFLKCPSLLETLAVGIAGGYFLGKR